MSKKITIYAPLNAIDGIGPKTAENIIAWRESRLGRKVEFPNVLDVEEVPLTDRWSGRIGKSVAAQQLQEDFIDAETKPLLDWSDLVEVKGVGPKTVEKILAFVEADDPFGVQKISRALNRIRESSPIKPTHVSIDMPEDGELCCYTGLVVEKKYYDAVEQLQRREDIEYDEALNKLKDNHLLEYAALMVEDEYGEVVRVSVDRWRFPDYAKAIAGIKKNRDFVVVKGLSSTFSGIGINRIKDLTVFKGE